MIKTGSLVALLLGIVLDIQGCGSGCPKNDAVPATKDDCSATNIATCMAADAVTSLTDACDLGNAGYCCFENCCDADVSVLPAELTLMAGDATTVKDVMDNMEELAKVVSAATGCKMKQPC